MPVLSLQTLPQLCFLTQRKQVSEDTEDIQEDILVTGALKWKHTDFNAEFRTLNFILYQATTAHAVQRL